MTRRSGEKPLEWLAARIADETDDCLIWPFTRDRRGYAKVRADGKMVRVHRHLLALKSLPPTPEHHAAHSCGNGHLGCVNLRHLSWKTRAENEADKVSHGTNPAGERNGAAKLTREQVKEIRDRSARGETQRSLAAAFGVAQATIWRIASGAAWQAGA